MLRTRNRLNVYSTDLREWFQDYSHCHTKNDLIAKEYGHMNEGIVQIYYITRDGHLLNLVTFYRAMHFSAKARYCHRMSSVCQSVRLSVRL